MRKLGIAILLSLGMGCLWWTNAHAQQMQPIKPNTTAAAADIVLAAKNLYGITANWNAATTARYVMVFDGTALPSNGAVAGCTASAVTGCLLWCDYANLSTVAPGEYHIDFTNHPIGAQYGLVIALSTGAGCGTLTADGANDFWYVQAR